MPPFKMFGKISFLLLACLAVISAEKARYDEYRVFRVVPHTAEQLNLLNLVRKTTTDLNFWNEPAKIGAPVLIMVPPHARSMFKDFLDTNGLIGVVTIPNVQKLIDEEERRMSQKTKAASFWQDYHDLDEINQWLSQQEGNSNFDVSRIVVGQTYKGKDIYGLKISKSSSPDLPGVVFESGIHAREWIAPAATSWIINEILNDNDENSIWHQFQYIYIPSVNPDGYEFTFTNDRMWRKSRKPYLGGLCYGADLNRNWDSHWMSTGASSNPCAEDFAGSDPFSEIETKSLSDFYKGLSSSNPGLYDIYISFHSFSQLLMYPWGYSGQSTPLTPIWDQVAGKAVQALRNVHGTRFDYGNIHDTIYPASGSSIEYYYEQFNSTLTYTFELRDTGLNGFLLPANQIIPSGEELKAAVETMLSSYLALKRSHN